MTEHTPNFQSQEYRDLIRSERLRELWNEAEAFKGEAALSRVLTILDILIEIESARVDAAIALAEGQK